MARFYAHTTTAGTFIIAMNAQGRWALGFESEALDTHLTPGDAAEAVARGQCMWPSIGNPSTLGIPRDLKNWIKVHIAEVGKDATLAPEPSIARRALPRAR